MIVRKRSIQQTFGKRFYQAISSVSRRTWVRSLFIASLLALLSFPVWQLFFSNLTLPVQIQMATDEVEYVRAYWNDPNHHPHAYERIPVALTREPVNQVSTIWQIKVEALAQKVPQAKSSQVWVLDVRTPESRIDWSEAKMQPQQWQLVDVPNAPQGKAAVALTEHSQSLQAAIKGSALTITLLRHPWSGRVRVTVNGQVRELDLFGATATTEELHFKPTAVETKKADLYEIRVVKTPWHRLRLVPEPASDPSRQARVDLVQVGDTVIRPEADGEFILPFYFWNQFSCTVAATILSFLGLTVVFTSVGHAQQRDPQFLQWWWFTHEQPRAMLKVRIASQGLSVLPYQAFKYFLVSLVVLVMGLFLIEGYFYYQETYQIGSLAALTAAPSQIEKAVWGMPQLASQEWMLEDERINRNNIKKILTSGSLFNPAEGDWVWRSAGFPVSQLSPKPKRILVMGDSFAWGHGYANMNDIWWRQLQRELIRRGYEQVEVIAAGLSGASTHQELEQARKLVKTYRPNLIIWGFVANDPDEGVLEQLNFKFVNQNSFIRLIKTLRNKDIFSRLNTRLAFAYARKITRTMSLKEYYREYNQWMLELLDGKNFELYRETIQQLDRLQAESNIPGFFITLSQLGDRAYNTYLESKVVPLLKKGKTAFYNTEEEFLKFRSHLISIPTSAKLDPVYMWRINPANPHPGTTLTYFSAVQAANILEAHYPEVLGDRTSSVKPSVIHINDWVPYDLNPIASSPGVLSFNYPASEKNMLRLPVNRPFIQLNLGTPVALKEIRLSGVGLQTANLDLTVVDSKLGFDTGTVYSFDQKQGTALVWNLEGQPIAKTVNTIRLSANVQNANQQLTLTLIPVNTGSQP